MRLMTSATLLAAVLLLASGALAAEADDFQVLLRHSGLPQSAHLPPGQSLTPKKVQALWRGLVDGTADLRTFAPRTTLARLLREASATNQALPYDELLARTARFHRLVVARPDGYCAVALTGTPISWLGQPTLEQGELYVQRMRVGAFYFDKGGVYFPVDEALRKQESHRWANAPWEETPPPRPCWGRRPHWRRWHEDWRPSSPSQFAPWRA